MSKKYVCSHTKADITHLAKTPFDLSIKNSNSVVTYFLYYAPNIESKFSVGKIEGEAAVNCLNKLIQKAEMVNRYKIIKEAKSSSWNEFALCGDSLCLDCSRMTYTKSENESELTALLRHIRNSLAHGLLYFQKKKKRNCLLLEDYSRKRKLTARIVISFMQLEEWKAILENQISIGE